MGGRGEGKTPGFAIADRTPEPSSGRGTADTSRLQVEALNLTWVASRLTAYVANETDDVAKYQS
jgi:hypothetical protein